MSESSVRTQLKYRATLRTLQPGLVTAFADFHHEQHQCRHEVERHAAIATMIALDDITNVECSGVGRVRADFAGMPEWHCLESINQYEGLGPFMGIGIAVRRGAESPNRSPRRS